MKPLELLIRSDDLTSYGHVLPRMQEQTLGTQKRL